MCSEDLTGYSETADCLTENRRIVMYYSDNEARKLVIEAGLKLVEQKLIARTWGNISARISKEEFVITPSGRAYDTLRPEDLVVVRVRDCSYDGPVKPSSEKGVHAAAYALRSEVSFIIHTHQYYASAVAADCKSIQSAPCAEYALPGSGKLRKSVEKEIRRFPEKKTFLMARHGTLILGRSSDEAFELAEGLEERCRNLVESRVPSHDATMSGKIDTDAIRTDVLPCVTVVSDPYIDECCRAGITVGAYIDDFAQIAGPDMQVVNDAWAAQRALLGYTVNPLVGKNAAGRIPMTGALNQRGGTHPVLNSFIGRNAVLVKGVGAVCAGKTPEDAEAVAMIVSKNCAAACYARSAGPLKPMDARLQRYIYLTSYSKRINSK